MENKPLISVLLPVYNSELYIKEAVDSILNQTYSHFELIIIDDCSTDNTIAILRSYHDSRINLIVKSENTGYTNSLNYGISIAKGKYIARMDGDDISLPERFEKQVDFLENNPEVVLCGTQYQIIGTSKTCNHPTEHDEIKAKLILGCYIAHPTVMFNKTFFDDNQLNYNTEMEPAEDYDLWSRVAFLGKIANLNEVFLDYRVHENQTSHVRFQKQRKFASLIKVRMLEKIFKTDNFIYSNYSNNFSELVKNNNYLSILKSENDLKNIYSKKYLSYVLKCERKRNDKNFIQNGNFIDFKTLIKLVMKPNFYLNIGFLASVKLFLKLFVRDSKNNLIINK